MLKFRNSLLVAAAAAISFASASDADAAIAINISQVGANVVVTGSGSFDTTGLTRSTSGGSFASGLNATFAVIRFGTGSTIGQVSTYGISGPSFFGSSSFYNSSTTAVGNEFGIFGTDRQVILPLDYVSGTPLAGTLTFVNATFASLGLTAGIYNYANIRDQVTVTISSATPAVPEPASWVMMILGMGVVGGALRRRLKVSTTVKFA